MKNIEGQPLNQLVGNIANSSGEGQTHLKKKNYNEYYGMAFPLLVYNKPSSSSCGKGPAHLENSKKKREKLNIIILFLGFLFIYIYIYIYIFNI